MPPRPLLLKQIQYAQSQTRSHAEAARYLDVSFTTYKRYAKLYSLYDTEHKNPAGKGLSKIKNKGFFGLQEILDGKHPNYDRTKLKERLVRVQYLPSVCAYCGHHQVRPDGRGPHTLDYKDGNRDNLQLENLQLICYNCKYLTTGHIEMSSTDLPFVNQDYTNVLDADEIQAIQDELMNST